MAESCAPIPNATLSAAAPRGYREAFLALFVLALLLVVSGVAIFIRAKKRSGRLAKRSATLVLVSAVAAIFSSFVVLFREYYGRELFPCIAVLTIHHLAIPLVTGPLIAKVYVHAYRLRRSEVKATLSFAAVKREQERIDRGENKPGQNLMQDMSAFVKLKGKRKYGEGSKSNATVFNRQDSFEVVSPVLDDNVYSIAEDIEDLQLSPISPSSLYIRQDSAGSDSVSPMKGGSRRSLVELPPGSPSSPGSPSYPRKSSNLSKSRTEDMLRKASRNSSTMARESDSRGHRHSRVLSATAGIGWWSPKAVENEAEIGLDELIKNESTLFGLFMVLIFAAPFIVVIVIRALTDPLYRPGCTGCNFSAVDVYIQCVLSVIMISIFTGSTIVLWNAPDPLGIIWEAKLCIAVFLFFCSPTAALYLTDPLDLEQDYKFTWLLFENWGLILILLIQTYGQVALTQWANRRVPRNISLIRLLENVELRGMFDQHLANEFSIENLRFWDRAIHWKLSYDEMPPEEIQRRARDLYNVFIQRDAAMALNLSSYNLSKLQAAFAPGAPEPVSRQIFDEALKECFKLMNDGLARFLISDKYREFHKHAPDFEGDMLRNKEIGLDLNVTVDRYLKQIDTLHARSSFTVTADSPRKASRTSIVSHLTGKRPSEQYGNGALLASREDEGDLDDEKARPLSMRVRKSVSQEPGASTERRRGPSFVQMIPPTSLSSPLNPAGEDQHNA